MLPFTTAQFFDVFTKYNTAVWPIQILFNCGTAAFKLAVVQIMD
jgi:hypothetical protein